MNKSRKKTDPPRLAVYFLSKLVENKLDTNIGDFEEEFNDNLSDKGYWKAYFLFWIEVFVSIPGFFSISIFRNLSMLANYFKTSIRSFKRNMSYSLINILGLSLGLTCFILIMLYVQYELSFDTFHEKSDDIYRVQIKMEDNKYRLNTSGIMARTMVDDFPEVISAARIEHRDDYQIALSLNKQRFYERGFFVDGSFFDIFTYQFTEGDPKKALEQPYSVVITEELAEKYFGDENPIGKTISILDEDNFIANVTGVIKKVPENTHLKFDFLASMASLKALSQDPDFGENDDSDFITYLKLNSNVDLVELNNKVSRLNLKSNDRTVKEYHFMPLKEIHLKSSDNFELTSSSNSININFLSIIAYIILAIACLNYMNLATVKAIKRSREIGIRKVVGAVRAQLIVQFLFESMLFCLIAIVIAVLITTLSLPAFNALTDKNITFNILSNLTIMPKLIFLFVSVGLLSGLYPAMFISSFRPVKALFGNYTDGSGKRIVRNFFVAIQFCVSAFLLIGTLIVGRQLNYIKTKDIGYEREQVMAIQIREDAILNNVSPLKTELLKDPAIQNVSSSSHIPNNITWGGRIKDVNNETLFVKSGAVDFDFVELFNVNIVEGRNFSREIPSDEKGVFLLSETALQKLGWESPLGMEINHWGMTKGKVVGVFKDFHFQSMHKTVEPLYLLLDPTNVRVLFIKILPGNMQNSIKFIQNTFESFNPSLPFEYSFLDDSFNDMYKSEMKFGAVFNYFSALAIIIACLGLFGLISYTVETRKKEIGIRKLLGASVPNIFNIVAREFVFIVIFANLIAFPVSYYVFKGWLQNYAYKIHIGLDIFLISLIAVTAIAIITVSYQSIKSSIVNPVHALRME